MLVFAVMDVVLHQSVVFVTSVLFVTILTCVSLARRLDNTLRTTH